MQMLLPVLQKDVPVEFVAQAKAFFDEPDARKLSSKVNVADAVKPAEVLQVNVEGALRAFLPSE
ncbi:MAG: hypothetical protein AAFP92_24075 [Bacteroidota bacterium]